MKGRLPHAVTRFLQRTGLVTPGLVIPYRHADQIRPVAYDGLEPLFGLALPRMGGLLRRLRRHEQALRAMGGPPPAPRFEQDWFPRLDAALAYGLVRDRRPRLIVEIGSGHSTRFLARAIADGGFPCRLVCVDPQPRAALGGLAIEHLPARLEEVPEALFDALRPNDLLFVDSSHVLVPGSDVDRIVNRLLPRLLPGVLVHLHDIFLPDPYPDAWSWRGYGEQMAVAALLQGGAYRILFASHHLVTRRPTWLAASVVAGLPRAEEAFESSLWLQKRAPRPAGRRDRRCRRSSP